MYLYTAIICRQGDLEEVVGVFSTEEKARKVLESEKFSGYTAFIKQYFLDTAGQTDFEDIVRILPCND